VYKPIKYSNNFKKMSAKINYECPICMDDIDLNKNCIATECGHRFHASCLMKSIAHNGFGCPYCRAVMAEEPEDDETEYTEDYGEEMFDDYALRGLRFFFNNLNGEQHDAEDVKEEDEDEEGGEDEEEDNRRANKPSVVEITQGLREKGITMECLVKCALLEHSEYDRQEVEFNRLADDIFDKISQIIADY
jgi:hypothetical protein